MDDERYSRLTLDFAESLHSGCALLRPAQDYKHELEGCPMKEFVIKNAQGHMAFLNTRGHVINEQKVGKAFLAIGLSEESQNLDLINRFLDLVTEPSA